ncbi:MAG: Hint domain-containing protein [Alphaproteobacteria bacterium]|nr:Hint domain-containing protein [Alphaproteobacteria bacterium]
MSGLYNFWSITFLDGTFTTTSTAKPVGQRLVSNDGNPDILGDTPNDTLTASGKFFKTPLDYVGTTTVMNGWGHAVPAFIVYDPASGNYFMAIQNGRGQPVPGQSLSVTVPTGVDDIGRWDLSTNRFDVGCFLEGTRIATPEGERFVQELVAGDLVLTADGRAVPVRWLGRSVVSRAFADPMTVLPVRVKAGALAEAVPVRDLLVSPGHALLVEGVLAHAGALVNGSSIVREPEVPPVFTYYHVELDEHALLLAEGAAAESFIEGVEDLGFVNFADRTPPAESTEMAYPRAKAPRQVPRAARERLAARAAALAQPVAAAA